MTELTHVINAEITIIDKTNDLDKTLEMLETGNAERNIAAAMWADDVHVTSHKVFISKEDAE